MKHFVAAKKFAARVLPAVALSTVATGAFAADTAIDTTSIISQIGVGTAATVAVGIAMLGAVGVVAAIKLVRRAF